jgi:integrase
MTMIEYVFRPSRRKNGKRVLCRLYSGRYSLARGLKPVTVALDTPDEQIARKRLRDNVIEKQREFEGMDSPKVMREAFRAPLSDLLADYRRHLESRHLSPGYVRDTGRRVKRMANEIGWQTLADVRPDTFERWFATLTTSAKTNREYQLSARAFLNWLMRIERLARNPLAKLDLVSARGREVRPYRAYTDDELRALFALEGERTLFYETLLYTGARKSEVASLVWRDLALKTEGLSVAVFRACTTKDREERIVPLHPCLVRELFRRHLGNSDSDGRVFSCVPSRKQLLHDLNAAGIERRDSVGRVVHFHAFRKTARTVAVRCGVSERICDAVLGHSNPNRMGTRYTDVSGLPLDEWTKLPWFGRTPDGYAQLDALKGAGKRSIRDVVAELVELVRVAEDAPVSEGNCDVSSVPAGWSGRQDLNLRPSGPKPDALPG